MIFVINCMNEDQMKTFYTTIAAAIAAIVLVGCGGGGGSSSTSSASTPAVSTTTTYQAGVAAGENGILVIDSAALTYKLTITDSSYGLVGQTFSGAITANSDGTYKIVGTQNGTIYVYPNYSVTVIKMDKSDSRFAQYFAANPFVTQSVYLPVFGLVKESLLTTTDDVTSNGASLEFRAGSFQSMRSSVGAIPSYSADALRGLVTKISDSSFSVAICSNEGQSAKDSQLTNALSGNCGSASTTVLTFTYSAANGAWMVTPDPAFPRQVVKAYFVNDTRSNEVVGYIDTSDASGLSSGMSIATIVPANTALQIPANTNATSAFTSYQLCASDSNCAGNSGELGVDYNSSVPFRGGQFVDRDTWMGASGPCDNTITPNSPANGFISAVYLGGPGACNQPGDNPNTMQIPFGSRLVNGKLRFLSVMVGYDPTVVSTPSQKIAINYLSEN